MLIYLSNSCFKSNSILILISFLSNAMHQIFIPAVTVRSWFTKSCFTNVALKGGDSFRNNSTYVENRHFYAIFAQHVSCVNTKSVGLVCV